MRTAETSSLSAYRLAAASPTRHPVATAARPLQAVEAAASLPGRYPDRPARLPAERVLEGEVLPRTLVAETLLADPHVVLHARATRIVPETTPPSAEAPAALQPSTVLFYLLHSSNHELAADVRGRNVDQYA